MTGAPIREPGVLSVRGVGRDRVCFAVGTGPWTYTTTAAIRDALLRLEESGAGAVLLAGQWLDETDVEALAESVR